MRLFSDSFVSSDFEATQRNNYQFIGAQIKTNPYSESTLKMDIAGGVAMGAPLLNFLNISEFYFESRQDQSETFYLGRKKMLWSELDARWDLGVWEPLFKWNPLAAEHQGLTGLFWKIENKSSTFLLFASPFYLPDQGPNFDIQNGAFVNGNPWFRRPPESIRIWNEATSIDYHFKRPNESNVVMQNSYGMKLLFGGGPGWRTQFSYIYKPANQLAIGYDGNFDLSKLKGVVDIQPQVFYQSLAAMDVIYTQGFFKMGLSGILDRPSKEVLFDYQWTHPEFEDAIIVSPYVEWTHGSIGLSLQHLDIFGGKVREVGDLADPTRVPLTSRYPFQQADQIAMKVYLGLKKKEKIQGKLSWTHSELNQFDLLKFSSRWQLSSTWSLMGELQLVKAGELSSSNQNEIAQYANNDRLMLGVAYAF
jgi:hypothetical protein